MVGCEYPKLRLVPRAVLWEDEKLAALGVKNIFGPADPVLIRKSQGAVSPGKAPSALDPRSSIEVKKFNSNEISLQAEVREIPGAWLVYAQAYYPSWRAQVDGRDVPIEEAYLAFQSVYLSSGRHQVRFYIPWTQAWMSYLLACLGFIFGSYFYGIFFREILTGQKVKYISDQKKL